MYKTVDAAQTGSRHRRNRWRLTRASQLQSAVAVKYAASRHHIAVKYVRGGL